ncbi:MULTISPECIES: YadA family autotransporter adhesin [Limnobaculum]|nr:MULTISPECIES: YadA-like family protein [Limnobaculum]
MSTNKISGLAAGTALTDAVNLSQLNSSISLLSQTGTLYFHANSVLADSNATGANSIAVGPLASASGINAIAIGNGATATKNDSVALGAGSTTEAAVATTGTTINGTVYTFAGVAPTSVVSIGTAGAERQLTHVAAGQLSATSTDAVNGSQLFTTNSEVTNIGTSVTGLNTTVNALNTSITNINNGVGIKYFHTNAVLADSNASGTDSVAVGSAATALGLSAIAIGNGATATEEDSVALGAGSTTEAAVATTGTTINGTNYTFAGDAPASMVSIGTAGAERQLAHVAAGQLSATSTDAVNGSQLFATNSEVTNIGTSVTGLSTTVNALNTSITNINNGVGIKYFHTNSVLADSNASGTDSVAVGPAAAASATNSIAIGNGATTTEEDSVALGAGSTTEAAVATTGTTINGTNYTFAGDAPASVVSIGTAGAERQLAHVAAGQLSATSTDAVNGSQLFATNSEVTNIGTSVTGLSTTVNALNTSITNINNGVGIKYFHTNSVLTDSNASGTDSVAVGPAATALGLSAIAIGNGATATEEDSVALGAGSTTEAAVGTTGTTINGTDYTFAGDAPASVVSIGTAGAERQLTHVAAGQLSATSTDAVNGSQLFATNTEVTNIGATITNISNGGGIKYFHANSTLADSNASGTDSIAMGPVAIASATNSIAIGNGATATSDGSIALGQGSIADRQNSISVGTNGAERQIINVAAGTNDTDAVNYAQLRAISDDALLWDPTLTAFSARHGTTMVNKITNVADGDINQTSTDAVNGSQLYALDNRVTSVDNRVTVIEGSISGGGIKYFHSNSSAADSIASGNNAVSIGPNAQASGENAISIGNGATTTASNNIALGNNATDNGRGAETYTGQYSGSSNTSTGTLSIGNAQTNETRTLSNLADGREQTDAVNLRQLDGAVMQANQYTDAAILTMGGDIQETRNIISNMQIGNNYMFQTHSNNIGVTPQSTGTDSTAGGAGAQATGENSTALGSNAIATANNSVSLGANSVADRENTVSVGSKGQERQITNVAPATNDTDAVNYSQLKNSIGNITNQANAYTDSQVSKLRYDLNKQDDVLSAGVASAMAMANQPQPTSAGNSMVTLSTGYYRDESALALGVSKVSESGRWVTKMQASTNTQGDMGVGVGIGLQW